jgi:hypothetical protein
VGSCVGPTIGLRDTLPLPAGAPSGPAGHNRSTVVMRQDGTAWAAARYALATGRPPRTRLPGRDVYPYSLLQPTGAARRCAACPVRRSPGPRRADLPEPHPPARAPRWNGARPFWSGPDHGLDHEADTLLAVPYTAPTTPVSAIRGCPTRQQNRTGEPSGPCDAGAGRGEGRQLVALPAIHSFHDMFQSLRPLSGATWSCRRSS